jgi:hypothetical protein
MRFVWLLIVVNVFALVITGYLALAASPTSSVKTVAGYQVVAACGTPPATLVAGQIVAPEMNTKGQLCVDTTTP